MGGGRGKRIPLWGYPRRSVVVRDYKRFAIFYQIINFFYIFVMSDYKVMIDEWCKVEVLIHFCHVKKRSFFLLGVIHKPCRHETGWGRPPGEGLNVYEGVSKISKKWMSSTKKLLPIKTLKNIEFKNPIWILLHKLTCCSRNFEFTKHLKICRVKLSLKIQLEIQKVISLNFFV